LICLPSGCRNFTALSDFLFLYGIESTLLKATMSFGFSVGDFVTAIELANRIRREFVSAPSQFRDISDE
jgi:hypothetical protein